MKQYSNRVSVDSLLRRAEELKSWNFLWLALSAIGIGIFLMGIPKYFDDWWFSKDFRSWFDAQGLVDPQSGGNVLRYGIPWNAVYDVISEHFKYDNTRFSNVLGVMLLLFPKWLGSIPGWISWMYVMYASLQLSGISTRRSPLVPAAVFMWILFLPWFEKMGVIMYQTNYIISSALVLLLIRLVLNPQTSWSRYCAIFVISFITGAWHEMNSIFLMVAFVCVILLCRGKSKVPYFVSLVGLMQALIWLILCPDFFNRVDGELWKRICDIKYCLKILIFYHYGILLYLGMALLYIYKRSWKEFLGETKLVIITAVCVCSLIMVVSVDEFLRSGWLGDVCSVIGIIYILNTLWPQYWRGYNSLTKILGAFLIIVSLSTLFVSDFYVLKYGAEYRKAAKMVGEGERDAVFVDIDPPDVTPYPVARFINDMFAWDLYTGFSKLYFTRQDEDGLIKIVPVRLKNFVFETGRKVPGNNDVRIIDKKYLVLPYQDKNHDAIFYDTDFGPVHKDEVPFYMVPFVNQRDGKRYAVLIMTDRELLRQLFGIDRMDISKWYTPRIYKKI